MDRDGGQPDHDPTQAGGPPRHGGHAQAGGPLGPDHTRQEVLGDPLPTALRETLDQDPLGGRVYIYRAGQLLVDADDSPRVQEALRRANALAPDQPSFRPLRPLLDQIGIDVLQVNEGPLTLEQLLTGLRTGPGGDTPVRAYPNHALSVASHTAWCPTGPPEEPPEGSPEFTPRIAAAKPTPEGRRAIGLLDVGFARHPYFEERLDIDEDDQALEAGLFAEENVLASYAGHGCFAAGILFANTNTAHVEVVARTVRPEPSTPTMIWVDDTMLAKALLDAVPAFFDRPNPIDVLVLPIAGPTHDGLGLPCTRRVLDRYRARKPDLVIVAAAGNDHTMTPYFPAAYDDVIGVAALAGGGEPSDFTGRAWFSNFGCWVDACAIGEGVYSTFPDLGGRATTYWGEQAPTQRRFRGAATWSGTSFAAPLVAAAIMNRINDGEDPATAAWNVQWGPEVTRITDLGAYVPASAYSRTRYPTARTSTARSG
jgi:Subtilase family